MPKRLSNMSCVHQYQLKHCSLQDELHHWSCFASRGLVAMANDGPNNNRSKFFYTLGRCDELSKKIQYLEK